MPFVGRPIETEADHVVLVGQRPAYSSRQQWCAYIGMNPITCCTPANTMPTTDVCIEQCKLVGRGKRKQHNMIQCTSICEKCYHNDCAAVKKDDIIGIWPCPLYREMPAQIREIKSMLTTLMKTVDTITATNSTILNQIYLFIY